MSSQAATPKARGPRFLPISPKRWAVWGVRLRGPGAGPMVLAVLIGVGTAGAAVGFRWLVEAITFVFTGHTDYAAVPGAGNPFLPRLGPWFVVGVPVVAGLLYGPLMYFFARETRGPGVAEVMYAVARRGGRIRPRVAAVKALASALTLGGGGSLGREGPIVQIGSALGSTVGQLVRAPEPRMRVLVACGAAGGIAATFNAPLAGVFFALELIIVDFAAQAFGLVVISSVVAGALGRAAFGDVTFLELPELAVHHPTEYLLFALLGVLAGAVGVGFSKATFLVQDGCDAVWRWAEWLRPAAGGLILGLLLLALPEMYGVGYPVMGNAIDGRYAVGFLLVLLVGKILAASLTLGIGGSGGVFSPSLFIGAMLGAAVGSIAHTALPAATAPVGAYALVGMGAVFAGAARAPITSVIVVFELTGEYSLILPLMAAVVLASWVSHHLARDTIYTTRLRRRGVDPESWPEQPGPARAQVSGVMRPLPVGLDAATPLTDVAARLAVTPYGVLPVADLDGGYLGVLTARAVAEALAGGFERTERAAIITELPATVTEDGTLDDAVRALNLSGCGGVPVFPVGGGEPVGWVTYRDVLPALGR